jgi:hypothetical protein
LHYIHSVVKALGLVCPALFDAYADLRFLQRRRRRTPCRLVRKRQSCSGNSMHACLQAYRHAYTCTHTHTHTHRVDTELQELEERVKQRSARYCSCVGVECKGQCVTRGLTLAGTCIYTYACTYTCIYRIVSACSAKASEPS